MTNIAVLNSLEKAAFLSKGARIRKISKAPIKLFYSKILELIALSLGKPILIRAKTFWNEDMLVVFPELVSVSIYRYGIYEEGLTRILLEHLRPGMTFFDIGAHFGYFTLFASVIVGTEGQVHSFEPTPFSFDVLRKNTLNKRNVILNNLAVLSKHLTVPLNDLGIRYSAYNSISGARLSQNILTKIKVKKHKVESISIDDYVERYGIEPDFIKIDAESSEYEIIIGMERSINNYHPIITVEVGDIGFRNPQMSKDLISLLQDKGYRPYEFIDGRIYHHTCTSKSYKYDNILFLPC